MAEKLKDAEDRLLESMFRADTVVDDGFSHRVVKRIRRRLWVQRLALPIAIVIGAGVAIKPATQLVGALPKLLAIVPQGVLNVPTSLLPQIQIDAIGIPFSQVVVLGAMLLGAAVLGIRLLEE